MNWTVIAQDQTGEVIEIVVVAPSKAVATKHARVDLDAIEAKDEGKTTWTIVGVTKGLVEPPVAKVT